MLHFIIGLAVCIWIVERIVHLSAPWRERRRVAREIREINADRETQRRDGMGKFVVDDRKEGAIAVLLFVFIIAGLAILH